MKKTTFIIVFIFAVNILYAQQTYLKIKQWAGFTLSAGSTIDSITFTSFPKIFHCGEKLLYGGETYPTKQIGSQCWFQKNLVIGVLFPAGSEQTDNDTIERYCYNNPAVNCFTYGGLYQWEEAMQYVRTEGAQGICPPGWHIPKKSEFQTLINQVQGNANSLKALGQGRLNGIGTNASGFSALLAGYRNTPSSFDRLGFNGYFWTSTIDSTWLGGVSAYALELVDHSNIFLMDDGFQSIAGLSVRCIKD